MIREIIVEWLLGLGYMKHRDDLRTSYYRHIGGKVYVGLDGLEVFKKVGIEWGVQCYCFLGFVRYSDPDFYAKVEGFLK